jgi:NAD(P)-dependent dehydrogenase (short-subunit alcohol dehydrogenase family)
MFSNSVAIITGGGSGIGEATALRFAAQDTAVALVGRREQKLADVARRITELGGCALVIPEDLLDGQAPKRIVERTAAEWGRIDYIVNNAAFIDHKPIETATKALFEMHMTVNVRAPYFLVQEALAFLRRSGSASIVNIASSSGFLAIPGQSMYGTSKSAIAYLTKSLAAELAPDVRVNCIAPGPVDTPIHKTWAGDHVEEAYTRMTNELPLKRMGRAEELAAWIVWLCSEQSAFVTGTVIPVDGGQTLPGAMSRISQ